MSAGSRRLSFNLWLPLFIAAAVAGTSLPIGPFGSAAWAGRGARRPRKPASHYQQKARGYNDTAKRQQARGSARHRDRAAANFLRANRAAAQGVWASALERSSIPAVNEVRAQAARAAKSAVEKFNAAKKLRSSDPKAAEKLASEAGKLTERAKALLEQASQIGRDGKATGGPTAQPSSARPGIAERFRRHRADWQRHLTDARAKLKEARKTKDAELERRGMIAHGLATASRIKMKETQEEALRAKAAMEPDGGQRYIKRADQLKRSREKLENVLAKLDAKYPGIADVAHVKEAADSLGEEGRDGARKSRRLDHTAISGRRAATLLEKHLKNKEIDSAVEMLRVLEKQAEGKGFFGGFMARRRRNAARRTAPPGGGAPRQGGDPQGRCRRRPGAARSAPQHQDDGRRRAQGDRRESQKG